jgi:branched-chain amino acid transport system substrate-binding protein
MDCNPFEQGRSLPSPKITSLVLLLTLGACSTAAGCGGRATPSPVWLAHVATLSGPDKDAGESAARGLRLAVEEINKDLDQGLGRPFKVLHSDARGKLEAFEAEATRLVAINRVVCLFGGTSPEEVERLDRAGVPVVTPIGTPSRGMSDAVYCTGIPTAHHARALARFAVQELNAERLLLVQDDRRHEAASIAEAFASELPHAQTKKDTKPPRLRRLRLGKETKGDDAAQQVREVLKQEPVQAVVVAGRPEDLRDLGPLTLPVLFAGQEVTGKALQAQRAEADNLYWVSAFPIDGDGPRAQDFAKRYKDAFKEEADVHAALAYEGLKLLNEAMIRAKDTLTLPRIREELIRLKDHNGLAGPLSFTPERQVRRPAFVVRFDGSTVKTVKRYNPDS